MNILHIVAGLPASGGGLAEVVPRLARESASLGHRATIATVADPVEPLAAAAAAAESAGVRIVTFPRSQPRPLFFSWGMRAGLGSLVQQADVVHVHSNWTFPVWLGCAKSLAAARPLVMSPHGSLDAVRLAHSAWKKRLAGMFDRCFLRRASAIHATSETERQWIQRYVGGTPRIEVIPIGVDLPFLASAPKPTARIRTVLSLGRLHPLKGLDLLLDAWHRAMHDHPPADAWRLLIAGPDEQGTRTRLEEQARALGLANVAFAGPLHGDAKTRAFAEADCFVLPSRSENFGIVVAEALAAGLPVVTTNAAPWAEVHGFCGWWVDTTNDAIAQGLAAAMQLTDAERAAMGAKGRALVEQRYQWSSVGQAMERLYQSLL